MTEPTSRFPNDAMPDPQEDSAVVSFLQTHAGVAPAPTPDLEDRLMQAIHQEQVSVSPIQVTEQLTEQQRRRRFNLRLAAFLGVILTGAALGVGLWQWLWPPYRLSTAELAQLEDFMVSGWDDAVQPNEATTDWDVLNDQSNPTVSLTNIRTDSPFFVLAQYPQP